MAELPQDIMEQLDSKNALIEKQQAKLEKLTSLVNQVMEDNQNLLLERSTFVVFCKKMVKYNKSLQDQINCLQFKLNTADFEKQ